MTKKTLEVLKAVRAQLLKRGWRVGGSYHNTWSELEIVAGAPLTLFEALWGLPVSVERVEARKLLRSLAGSDVLEWGAHPLRTRVEVFELLDKAIRLLGGAVVGVLPRGPRVSHGPWKAVAS